MYGSEAGTELRKQTQTSSKNFCRQTGDHLTHSYTDKAEEISVLGLASGVNALNLCDEYTDLSILNEQIIHLNYP